MICVPVKRQDITVIGVLQCVREGEGFDNHDEMFLNLLSQGVAAVLERLLEKEREAKLRNIALAGLVKKSAARRKGWGFWRWVMKAQASKEAEGKIRAERVEREEKFKEEQQAITTALTR